MLACSWDFLCSLTDLLNGAAAVSADTYRAIAASAVTTGPQEHGPHRPALFDRYAALLAAGYVAAAVEMAQRGRALPGAAETIAALARSGKVVQSVLTGNLRPVAETKLQIFGLDAGLDLNVGAYGTDDDVRANLVPVARRRAAEKYQTDFPARATVLCPDQVWRGD